MVESKDDIQQNVDNKRDLITDMYIVFCWLIFICSMLLLFGVTI
jgi:hypothetical protein